MKSNRSLLTRLIPLVILLLAAFALRAYRLDYFSLRGDESFTVLFVQKPFAQMWNEIRTVEPNPPLLYFLLRLWVSIAGAGEFAARYFSLFWGVLCVPLVYRLSREIFAKLDSGGRERASIAAALLIAINPYQIWHSQDVRNYTMWPALSLLALIFFWQWCMNTWHILDGCAIYGQTAKGQACVFMHQWRNAVAVQSGRSTWPLVFFTAAELAALYTHYYEAFILLGLNLYVLIFLWRRRAVPKVNNPGPVRSPLVQWTTAQLVLALLYLPFPLVIANRVSSYGEGSGKQGVPLWEVWQRTFSAFTLGETLDDALRSWLWIPIAIGVSVAIWVFWRRERRGLFFLIYAGIPTFAVFALNVFRPLFLERYLNGIAPAYYILLGYGISLLSTLPVDKWGRRWIGQGGLAAWQQIRSRAWVLAIGALTLLALFALANYYYNPAYAKSPDWRSLAHTIDAAQWDGDVILQNFPETSLIYYSHSALPLVVYPKDFFPDAQTAPALERLNARYRRVWFIPAAKDFWDPDQFVETWLDRHNELQSETAIATFRLELYSTPLEFRKTMEPVNAKVGSFSLEGYRLQPRAMAWHLVLYWRGGPATKKSYNVFLYMMGDDPSHPLAQIERPPVDGSFPTYQWREGEVIVDSYDLHISDDARAVMVGMNEPGSSQPLPVSGGLADTRGEAVVIPLSASK